MIWRFLRSPSRPDGGGALRQCLDLLAKAFAPVGALLLGVRAKFIEQVNLVGRQHAGVYGAVVLARGFAQFPQVVRVIALAAQARLAVIAALDDVLGNAGDIASVLACHARTAGSGIRQCSVFGDAASVS